MAATSTRRSTKKNPRRAPREETNGAALDEETRDRLGDVLEFMRLLWSVDHGLQATSKRMAKDLGITGAQRLVIRVVGRFPGISAGRLAEILCLHPSTLTGVLDRLTKRKYVAREVDPTDARRAVLKLTAKGKEMDTQRSGTVEAAVRRALGKADAKSIAAAKQFLSLLGEELTEGE
jgi:MarR family transcriptional regulator, organic hydroperoxide resistance regulator